MNTLIPIGSAPAAKGPQTALAALWRDGAILRAVVRGRTPEGLTRLEIGRHTIDARGGRGLSPGQRIDVQVAVERDRVLLKQLGNTPAAPVRDAVRQALPRQAGQPPLLANLGYLARPNPAVSRPAPLVDVARSLLATLPTRESVTRPDGLRAALRDSGVFLEQRLARQATTGQAPRLDGDWKAALLRAAAGLDRLASAQQARTGSTPVPATVQASARPTVSPDSPRPAAPTPARGAPPPPPTTGTPSPTSMPANATPAPGPTALSARGPTAPLTAPATPGATPAPAPASQASAPPVPTAATTTTEARMPPTVRPGAADVAPPPLRAATPAPQPAAPPTLPALDGRAAVTELSNQLSGVLARLTLSQLASLPTDASTNNAWIIELPVRNAQGDTDVFEFRFEREAHAPEDVEPAWSVQLSFDFESTGPVYARVTVRGDEVTTRFRARNKATSDLIAGQLDRLRSRFEERGLCVNALGCHTGEPPRSATVPGGFVETRA